MKYILKVFTITCMQQVDLENAKKFGERLRKLRVEREAGLNSFVMQNGGITTATWSRLENAKTNAKLSSLIKIAAVLGITVDELLKDIDFDYTIVE